MLLLIAYKKKETAPSTTLIYMMYRVQYSEYMFVDVVDGAGWAAAAKHRLVRILF